MSGTSSNATTIESSVMPDKLGSVSVTTYTEPQMLGEHHLGEYHCIVIGAALEGNNCPVVVFEYRSHTATLHISATGEVRRYDAAGLDTVLLVEDLDRGLYSTEMYASPGQADYCRRVLSLLIPHMWDLDYSDDPPAVAECLVPRLVARAERHVWCVRDDQDGDVIHASAQEYSDGEFDLVCIDYDDAAHERFLDALGDDEDEVFEPQGEHRLKIHRVPESDIPAPVEIIGCRWPRDLINEIGRRLSELASTSA
ncbi:hypothetical protein [Mycobacteroides chelonae]|uniref:hypothetical protein n=1 Tax=Mycobacteroides chelonae TaxID=1774 RepID=UPI000AFA6A02|nr:hypothetical protein [Mycobacteroides chelonae]